MIKLLQLMFLALFLPTFNSTAATDMRYREVLCAHIHGVLLDNGKPVVGARLERTIEWNADSYPRKDYISTNEKGEYKFTEMQSTIMPENKRSQWHTPKVKQTLRVTQDWGTAVLYTHTRKNYLRSEELGTNAIYVASDLAQRERNSAGEYMVKSAVKGIEIPVNE